MNFKEGQKVKCINNYHIFARLNITIGKIYKIVKIDNHKMWFMVVNDNKEYGWYSFYHFIDIRREEKLKRILFLL